MQIFYQIVYMHRSGTVSKNLKKSQSLYQLYAIWASKNTNVVLGSLKIEFLHFIGRALMT